MKPKPRVESVMVRYVFSESEKMELGQKMAAAIEHRENFVGDKKAMAASFNEKIQSAENDASRFGRCLTQGYESRMVECDVFYDYTSRTVSWIRRDNREVAERREMTHKELQMEFEDVEES